MVAIKEVTTTEPTALLADWVAIIYNPAREFVQPNTWNELTGGGNIQRMPAGRVLMLPLVIPKNHQIGDAIETRSIFLKPGANLSTSAGKILLSDWQAILKADEEKGKRGEIQSMKLAIQKGVYEEVHPDLWDGIGSPGYRHFSPELAKKLILATTHEDWLAEWMAQETRAEIIKASSEQKERIIAAKKRNAA
ncbi:hypothetical protein [Floridanema evergladense]|uniref:Uncharacterized protein n=1 Tax=Floridaenema evergladense BLCC-F167 TaxID=3153639 RepID=A0ABV4WCY9_9CYAN